MAQQDKYYFINNSWGRFNENLCKWNERFTIDVYEHYEGIQSIDVYLLKYKGKCEKPTTEKYQKVRPVLKEIFDEYYFGALKYILKKNTEDWEHYITQNQNRWIKIEAYSVDGSGDTGCLIFDLKDDIEDLYFSVYSSRELRGRAQARKKADLITYEHFKQIYNASFQFLSDQDSLIVNHKQFISNYNKLVTGKEDKVELLDFSADKSFSQIVTTLEKRKIAIEKRLIENDQDTKEKRLQLRGELEGIVYALKTIKIYK